MTELQDALQLHPSGYTAARLGAWGLAFALFVALGRRQGIGARDTLAIVLIGIPLSVVGAWLLDVLEYAGAYPSLAGALARNGSSIYGGLILAWLGVWAYAALRSIAVLRVLDAGAPAMALGEAVSRIGCWLAGCCYGVPWNGPWAVTFPPGTFAFSDQISRGLISSTASHTVAVHPVQIYSVVAALAICLWLVPAFFRRHSDGQVFFRFLISYGALRLAMAPFRIEALSSMKLLSVGFIVVGGTWLLITREARIRAADAAQIAA